MDEIRFVGTGETRGYPYLVCKNLLYLPMTRVCSTLSGARNFGLAYGLKQLTVSHAALKVTSEL